MIILLMLFIERFFFQALFLRCAIYFALYFRFADYAYDCLMLD